MVSHCVLKAVVSVFLVLTLFGCGGGGGDSSTDGSANVPPNADAGIDKIIYLAASETQAVTLTGSATDSDGTIVDHQWAKTGGIATLALTGADTNSVSFVVPAIADTYTFGYTANDDDGATATDDISVTVILNSPPVVDAGADVAVSGTQTVTLTGSTTDSDGTIVAHQWEQTGGTTILTLSGADTNSVSFVVPATTDTYTFSYTATDDDGATATDTVGVYASSVIFSDSFANVFNWSYENDTTIDYSWVVTSGQLRQSNYLANSSSFYDDTTTYHEGTYAVLDPLELGGATDYRFSVDVTPLPNDTNSDGNDVGIMFRYLDGSNYYRVSMNAKLGFTRFEKRTASGFETLAVNAIGYVDSTAMTMTAEVNGDTIVVWIDGDPVFAVVDADIASGSVALYSQDNVQFDNVLITEPPLQPLVVISSPLAYSVTPGDSLTVEAVVLNTPSGGSVGMLLDSGTEMAATASASVYSYSFTEVADGDRELVAVLRDAGGNEVSSDINSTVGVGGDYIVTVGDSITAGTGDTVPANNDSADGRIVSIQGYQAPLADLLTTSTGLPQIVFNEGVPGDKAADLAGRIDSIMERHPGASKVLLLIGTNDSSGTATPSATFGTTVGAIATAIDGTYGKDIWLAKILQTYQDSPPTLLDTTRNDIIDTYNNEIQLVVDTDNPDNTYLGPNFYSLFINSASLYEDDLHPNDDGYDVMAAGWRNTLMFYQ